MITIKENTDGTFDLVPAIPVEGTSHPTQSTLVSTGVLLLREAHAEGMKTTGFPSNEKAMEAARAFGYVTEEGNDLPVDSLTQLVDLAADPNFHRHFYDIVPPERRRLFDAYLRAALAVYHHALKKK